MTNRILNPLSAACLSIGLAAATAAAALVNADFENTAGDFPAGWLRNGEVRQSTGLAGASAVSLSPNAAIHQDFVSSTESGYLTFTATFTLRIDGSGNVTTDTSRVRLRGDGNSNDLITLRLSPAGIQCYGGSWSTAIPFTPLRGRAYPITVTVANLDADPAFEYRIACFNGNSEASSDIIQAWHNGTAATTAEHAFETIRFEAGAGNTLTVDTITLAGQRLPSDKIVNISGIYPHLAVTNSEAECGIGAIVPWQGDLWAITYGPHLPTGSNDKLYQLAPDLGMTVRPESVGGTPANRFIHTASNQLILGPHFIDASKTVRTLPYSIAPGRFTAAAAHLTDPANRIYIFTMEDGLYDVNVHDLSVITRYPDVQGTGDGFLSGYHGKGAYTGGGRLIVANNGRPNDTDRPDGPSGVLASWDGGLLGGAVNPQRMTPWTEHHQVQHCEVSGPGGIYGNPSISDPVWATGFDFKSVLLRTFENGSWTTWRLPKSSFTHDGSHGWHTEWPRIREIAPDRFLMHMHGMFYDFPRTFSAADFSGLSPICSYVKMPVDYCAWEGRLVIAKNDTSRFSNNLVPRAQSNFWFGQPDELRHWGAPQGHGSLWRKEPLTAGQSSEPFLIEGFQSGTIHFRNDASTPLPVEIQISSGTGGWQAFRTLNLAANSYRFETFTHLPASWLRLIAGSSSSSATATLVLGNPYPHATPASASTSRFAALADIRDTRSTSDGLIRVMSGPDLKLEFAANRSSASGATSTAGYFQIGGPMDLTAVSSSSAEASVRSTVATTRDFGSDAASAWITIPGTTEKLRLPKTDPLYDSAFAGGWARGFREAVTERVLLNCHGTFYEVPRDNSGGRRKLQPITTHGKRITDFTSWRGMLALTGVLDSAPASDSLIRSTDGSAALWLGEIDDLWRMGEPRGTGGPWLDTAVAADVPSDPYLMYGYHQQSLELSHQSAAAVTFTIQVDFLADNSWSDYGTFTVPPGEMFTHAFPDAFQAHWVRLVAHQPSTATARFTYGPAATRDRFLDWAREASLPTGEGRPTVARDDTDGDGNPALIEYVLGNDPRQSDAFAYALSPEIFETVIRSGLEDDSIRCRFEISTDLLNWIPRPDLFVPAPDQTNVPAGFIRMRAAFEGSIERRFVRLHVSCP